MSAAQARLLLVARLMVAVCSFWSSSSAATAAHSGLAPSSTLRIALVGNNGGTHFPTRDYGGIEISVEHAAWGLHSAGVPFFVVVPADHSSGGQAHECRTGDYPFEIVVADGYGHRFSDAAFVALAARRDDYDVIWAQSHWAGWGFAGLGKPLIVTLHDSTERHDNWIVPVPFVRTRFVSEAQRDAFVKGSSERNATFAVHHGLPEDEFSCPEPSTSGGGYHLFVAGLHWQAMGGKKGLGMFVDLARAHPAEQFRAYGAGNFPAVVAWLREKEEELPNFSFGGALARGEEHRRAFCEAATFVMPTQIPEAFGLTVIEALSKGTPVVASDRGALPEILHPALPDGAGSETRLGIATGSLEAMSAALLRRDYNRTLIREQARERFHLSRTTAEMLRRSHALLRDLGHDLVGAGVSPAEIQKEAPPQTHESPPYSPGREKTAVVM